MKKLILSTVMLVFITTSAWSQQKTLTAGTYKPECDAVSITFNADLTFEAQVNLCDKYEKWTGTYKVNGNDILCTTKDFESVVLFTLSDDKDYINQTRTNQLACGKCDESDSWFIEKEKK
jgi:hypothetical protein